MMTPRAGRKANSPFVAVVYASEAAVQTNKTCDCRWAGRAARNAKFTLAEAIGDSDSELATLGRRTEINRHKVCEYYSTIIDTS